MEHVIIGTLDEIEPKLRALGFSGVQTMAGVIALDAFHPYGNRNETSVNYRSTSPVYRGVLEYCGEQAYLCDAYRGPGDSPFLRGMFPLVKG
jgi:hypothetical protein